VALIPKLWTRKKTALQLLDAATAADPEVAWRWAAAWPAHRESLVAYVALPWGTDERDRRIADVLGRIAAHEESIEWLEPGREPMGGDSGALGI
jgi:hypothetical protein